MIDMEDVCDEVWHGTNGEDLLPVTGCPGCHYVAGAAVALGLIAMAEAIRARPFDPFASYNAGRDRSKAE